MRAQGAGDIKGSRSDSLSTVEQILDVFELRHVLRPIARERAKRLQVPDRPMVTGAEVALVSCS